MGDETYIQPLVNPVLPDAQGFFGQFGGTYVPEILHPNLEQLSNEFTAIVNDSFFWKEFTTELQEYSGRPTPITFAKNLTDHIGGAKIYLKREDLNQTGAHKINNVIGQGLLMKRLGKSRVIAETGAGQHGVATATMAARFGMEAHIYMGIEDINRQRPNVFWMERMGAKVIPVTDGSQTLKDAINAALRDWVANLDSTHYCLGTASGPHPYPAMVSYFQSVIGIEARQQMLEKYNGLPDKVFACVGGGSNAMGIFQGFMDDDVELVGVEAGGKGKKPGEHASRIASHQAQIGIAHGTKTQLLQTEDGQLIDTYSIAAGLDYVGISPILAHWAESNALRCVEANDAEVIEALKLLIITEGIIPALESAHAIAAAIREAKSLSKDEKVLVNLSGRGDKDIFNIANVFADDSWREYLHAQAQEQVVVT